MSGIISRLAQTVAPAARAQTSVSPALAGLGSFKAYHASPHDINRFDQRFANMGEGVQSYAAGTYLAKEPKVADAYYEMFAGRNGLPASAAEQAAFLADRMNLAERRQMAVSDRRDAEEDLRGPIDELWGVPSLPESDPFNLKANRIIGRLGKRYNEAHRSIAAMEIPNQRKRYEVEVGVPEGRLLDWEAALGAQPSHVREAFERFGVKSQGMTGGRAYDELTEVLGGNPRMASGKLLESGVPGARYLDGFSRDMGEGTRNYVMFPGTEDMIKILRKYSILAPLAGAAASQSD